MIRAQHKKFWEQYPSSSKASQKWDEELEKARIKQPIRHLKHEPKMVGITPKTRRFLTIKGLWYTMRHKYGWLTIGNLIIRRPIRILKGIYNYLTQSNNTKKEDDFYFYDIGSEDEFVKQHNDKKTITVFGFSYCHKPFECPSGRFSNRCEHQINHRVCSQCYISKAYHQIPTRKSNHFTVIPTIHDIGETIIELLLKNPNKNILFLISACEMTLEMFQPWSRMTQIKGIGIRLGGRICNTMKAFDYSERGIKPGLTTIRPHTQDRINRLLETLRSN
jgi:hypothetical protein